MRPHLLYFLIIYSAGIIASKFINISFIAALGAVIMLLCYCCYLMARRQLPPAAIAALIFLIGIFAYKYATLPLYKNDISNFINGGYIEVAGFVIDEPQISDDKTRFTIRTEGMADGRGSRIALGKMSVCLQGTAIEISYGNRVRVKGCASRIISNDNFDLMSYSQLMESRGVYSQMFSDVGELRVIDKGHGNPIKMLTILIKNRLLASLRKTLEEPYSSLLGSIIFGSTASPLPDDLKEDYRNAGVIHLLVVSGTQISILLAVSIGILKSMGLNSVLRTVIASIFNLLFVIMVGAGPSIIRAAIMGEVALLAGIFQKENDFYNTLSFSALLLVIMDPMNLFDVGFQLSFLATWALFYVAPAFEEKFKKSMPPFFANLLAISIAPTLATTPISFYNFSQISFVSIFANMMIVPWIETIVVLGFFSTLIGAIFVPIALLINGFLFVVLAILNMMVSFFSHIPFAYRYIIPPTLPVICCYYIILVWWIEVLKNKITVKFDRSWAAIVVLIVLAVLVWNFAAGAVPNNASELKDPLVITVIDVGQGDSILVRSPSGKTMLIDGGGKYSKKGDTIGKKIVVPYIQKQGINQLDVVVLTHPHDDHVGGLVSVLEKFPVKLVIDSGKPHTSYSYIKFLNLIDKKNIAYKLGRVGDIIDLGGGVKGYILGPTDGFIKRSGTDLNNSSIVIRLVYKSFSMLLVGDLGFPGEENILKQGIDLKSDILKIGHHGSSTSTSDKLLKAVSPEYAVISVGAKNKFGHPSDRALERLAKFGVMIYRTDKDGAVMIKTDGEKMIVSTRK